MSLGPDEFIFLIHNAKKIFTDSYHGAIFSIIFHVPLVLCKREGTSVNMTSRFETLFLKLGIDTKQLPSTINDVQFNYSEIKKRLAQERLEFDNYLQKCLTQSPK